MSVAGAPSPSLLVSSDDRPPTFRKGSKFSYTLDFLLSIRQLDRCQRLPCNLDSSVLWDLEAPVIRLQPPIDFSKTDCKFVRSSFKSSPESGILGKGALLRAPSCLSLATDPKTQDTSVHLLARSAAPYRPPHLYKLNLHPEIDDGGDKAFTTSEANRVMKTEEETQKGVSESLWKDREATQGIEENASVDQKENFRPSNATGTSDFKKQGRPVEENGNSDQSKNRGLKVDHTPNPFPPDILSWFKEATRGNQTDSISTSGEKHGTESLTDHIAKVNDNRSEFKASTYPSAAEVVFRQLHEWDKSTKERQENSGVTLLASFEESTSCIDSLIAAFCVCDEEETATGDSAQKGLVSELDELPVSCTEADASPAETKSEISSPEICWPEEDALITINDFICCKPHENNGISGSDTNSVDVKDVQIHKTPDRPTPKSNRNLKQRTPSRVSPPHRVYPTGPPPPYPGLPTVCLVPLNQLAGFPPFLYPHQIYGHLPANPGVGEGGDLGMFNNWPFDDLKHLAGGDLGWPWFGNDARR